MTDGLIYVLPEKLHIMVNNTKMSLDEEQKNRLLYIPYLTNQILDKLAAFFWHELVKDQERMRQQSAYEMDDIELAQRFAKFLMDITNPLNVLKDENYFAKVNTPGNVVLTVDIHVSPKQTENILSGKTLTSQSNSIQYGIAATKWPSGKVDHSRNDGSTIKSQVAESDKIRKWTNLTKNQITELDFARKTKVSVPSDDILVIKEHKSVHNEARNTCEKKNGQKGQSRTLKNIFGCLFPCLFRRRSSKNEERDM